MGLTLADYHYDQQGTIDAILGVEVWIQIVNSEVIRVPPALGIAQKTELGYVIFDVERDPYMVQKPYIGAISVDETHLELTEQLRHFWELESIPNKKLLTTEQRQCEEIFIQTHARTSEGRYVVRIPFKPNIAELGKSKSSALRQFFALESRLRTNQSIKEQYHNFMTEYEKLGHMQEVKETSENGFYTPHHAVMSSAKFRTVFNASARTSSGLTLNETQMTGEKLQPDLYLILLNFRKFKYGMTADIVKMYRQILVHPEDRKFQKILWRWDSNQPVSVFELNTVTYGHTCAPHCAIRALVQCARDNAENFPLAARQIETCFYVDDYISGEDSIQALEKTKSEVSSVLQRGCFELAKWRRNLTTDEEMEFKDEEVKAVLGLFWNPRTDQFLYKLKEEDVSVIQQWTKRKLLSKIGRLYDPLGFLGPVIVRGKLFIQQLWKSEADWDEALTPELERRWIQYNNELKGLTQVRVNRWFKIQKISEIQLHGFCDASEQAYGAVLYTRVRNKDGDYDTTIITSKSRVAPLKVLTMPRLELCAATLLTDLIEKIRPTFETQGVIIHAWTDSQITMNWISKEQSNLKIFVANRVANIKEKSENLGIIWNWVSGKENPADVISRGVSTEELLGSSLWWNGPSWLKSAEENWPKNQPRDVKTIEPEIAKEYKIHAVKLEEGLKRGEYPLLKCYGDWKKLLQVTIMILRAGDRFRKFNFRGNEADRALHFLVRMDQTNSFGANLIQSQTGKNSLIAGLNVKIIPGEGIIRVDGRLRGDYLTNDEKFPILLARDSIIGGLLIRDAHYVLHHGGNQLMMQYIRNKFWLIGARILIKAFVRQCPICFRWRMKPNQQMMAALPESRTKPQRAFLKIGVDYAGPVMLRSRLGRNPTLSKAYIAVFVCLVTRAVHLELVSDSTTTAFIAAFRRMVARRGTVIEVLSDNGTNFVGANNFLQTVIQKLDQTSIEGTFNLRWKFITPNAPHHGGIYEAAVKSAKHHLRRIVGESTLTFEEYATLLSQTEACLNSRPLKPMSDDATDLTALTPGHFLIGEALIAIPEEGRLTEVKAGRLARFQHVQQMVQHFWKRWHHEYLMDLVNRTKWKQVNRNLQIGDLVILYDANSPPTKWKLGRIQETYPGKDGLVRSVLVRTEAGILKRPITKMGLLQPNLEIRKN